MPARADDPNSIADLMCNVESGLAANNVGDEVWFIVRG